MGSRTGRRYSVRRETGQQHEVVTTHTPFSAGVLCRTSVEVHRGQPSPDRIRFTSDIFAPRKSSSLS